MQKWIVNLVATYLLKNWRTTVVGVIGFIVTQFPQVKVFLASHGYAIADLQGLIILVIAFFAKDGSVSGGAPASAVSVIEDGARGAGALLLIGALTFPVFAHAQVDPTTSTIDAAGPVDAVVQAAPDPRWSFKLGAVTVSPSASFTPTVISLKDFSVSVGPNVGAGLDWVWANGYGAATHVTLRETAVGTKPLASIYGILPFLAQYKIRPGVSYQIGGGVASFKDSFIFGVSLSDNFGYAAK